MKLLFFVVTGVLAGAPSVRLDPAVITACENGLGQATVFWDGGGVAPVVLSAGVSPMTGAEATKGSAQTGQWVTDGRVFSLRSLAGELLAETRAALQCDSRSYWPLDIGNEWHFRLNSRVVTGAHAVWRVTGKELIDGVTWSVLNPGPFNRTRLRTDANNRIYRLADDGREILLFDSTGLESGVWVAEARSQQARTLAGTLFGDEITWRGPVVGLGRETGRLARGVGPTYYEQDVVAGSSGGFGSGYTMLEAVVNGARFVPNYSRVELSVETQTVNLEAKAARNCAIPCYFAACFGADLPGVYTPCMEASVRGGTGKLALLDPSGGIVYETVANGWVRIPLYREPATVLPAGKYSISATINGATVSLPLEIQ